MWGNEKPLSILLGKTLTAVTTDGKERITFSADDGSAFLMHHEQDCCENVEIEDISGSLDDLVGALILRAEERTNSDEPAKAFDEEWMKDDSFTWTFYELATIKGSVTIRWYGSSNGYYSERVTFEQMEQA